MRIFTRIPVALLIILAWAGSATGQENAAPSMHLSYYFPSSDAVLKMQKIKIVQSAYASYFEVNWFTNGYAGLQQTPDTRYGKSNILISSLWDPNTAAGIYSYVDYNDPTTVKSRFGGEGDGWKTINPYDWKLNNWYNIVQRAWKSDGILFIATFINDVSTGKWFHSATISIPYPQKYLNSYNDAFLENWDGTNSAWNGSFIRKAFFKDCWNLNTGRSWEKNTRAVCSVNNSDADIRRNGIYHNAFNAWFDTTEDAYCMQHGGNTIPSTAFNGGRTLNLPAQTNQGRTPTLTTGTITSLTATYDSGTTEINWTVDNLKSPQLSAKLEISNSLGMIIQTLQDTIPQRRNFTIDSELIPGEYTARLTIRDIFNQLSVPVTQNFSTTGIPDATVSANEIIIYPNPASQLLRFNSKIDGFITIFDFNGKQLLEKRINDDQINIGNLKNGIYLMRIHTSAGIVIKKFIKESEK